MKVFKMKLVTLAILVVVTTMVVGDSTSATCPSNGSFPDQENCTMYWRCDDPFVYHESCPRGSYFDINHSNCTDGYCKDSPTPTVEECKIVVSIPDNQNCTSYYRCINLNKNWFLFHYPCPSGNYYDRALSTCRPGICPGTPPPFTVADCKDSKGINPDPQNCTGYIQCVQIHSQFYFYRFQCPKGYYYDKRSFLCSKGICNN